MWRLFDDEFRAELDRPHRIYGTKQMDVVTGTLAAPLLTACTDELRRQYPMIDVAVHPIQNNFFGGNVSVAGLVTATDIIAQCKGRLHSTTLGVPEVMLRSEKDMFLDSITVEQLAAELGVKVEILPAGGGDLARALLRSGLHIARKRKPASQT
jgi:NifB/MoaA-like Fe-S oxidoreductase